MKGHLQELKLGGRPMTKNELKIIELQQRIDKAIEKLYLWGETLNPTFQKEMLEILGDKEK